MKNKAVQKNIFEEINRTIELKNKLTVAKNNINKVIVRGGGKQSQTLEEMPANIESMVKQYSKIAIIDVNVVIPKSYVSANYKIPLNLDFMPKYLFIYFKYGGNYNWRSTLSYPLNSKNCRHTGTPTAIFVKVTQKEAEIEGFSGDYEATAYQVIAIG